VTDFEEEEEEEEEEEGWESGVPTLAPGRGRKALALSVGAVRGGAVVLAGGDVTSVDGTLQEGVTVLVEKREGSRKLLEGLGEGTAVLVAGAGAGVGPQEATGVLGMSKGRGASRKVLEGPGEGTVVPECRAKGEGR